MTTSSNVLDYSYHLLGFVFFYPCLFVTQIKVIMTVESIKSVVLKFLGQLGKILHEEMLQYIISAITTRDLCMFFNLILTTLLENTQIKSTGYRISSLKINILFYYHDK